MGKLKYMLVTFATSLLFMCLLSHKESVNEWLPDQPDIKQPDQQREKHKVMVVRLLILKHCKEKMADDDANLAIQGAKKAETKGLSIKVIGNHHVDGFSKEKLQEFSSKEMWNGAVGGDTVIIHTIGHGGRTGGLASLGQRSEVMTALANAADANHQKVLWWQLSCYASSKLPPISSLPPSQQELFSVYASSNENEPSPTDQQAILMGKIFDALAEKSTKLDLNGDGIITTAELKAYMNTLDNRRCGELLYSKNQEQPIFGDLQFAGQPGYLSRALNLLCCLRYTEKQKPTTESGGFVSSQQVVNWLTLCCD